MSQQIDDDQKVVEPIQNDVAIAGAIVQNDESQPSVFKLDTDCWDEVFDFLSLEDVHSFGQTCKAFQRVTGQYFQWMYEDVYAECKKDGIYINGKRMNGFSAFVPKLLFFRSIDDSMLRYVESNCKAVKQMRFMFVDFNGLDYKLIENILRKLETVELYFCKFDRDIFGALIESCVNLKRMVFEGIYPTLRRHPTLQNLELYPTASRNNDELFTSLEHSPNVRSLQMDANLFWDNRASILRTKVILDNLTIIVIFDAVAAAVIGLLNDLHQRGFYKRLHLYLISGQLLDQFLALPGLVTLYKRYEKMIGYYIGSAVSSTLNIF